MGIKHGRRTATFLFLTLEAGQRIGVRRKRRINFTNDVRNTPVACRPIALVTIRAAVWASSRGLYLKGIRLGQN
jgi:hypothetical protein